MPTIKLFEFEPTRSARCRWTLLEVGLEYESEGGSPAVFGSEELKKVHPLGKLPAAIINGKPLFESAAISTAIADLVPERNLVAKPGTWSRALHDQWTQFVLADLESWVWSSFINTVVLPEEQRVVAHLEQNEHMFRRGLTAVESHLSSADYLVENRFTVADIVLGYTLDLANRVGIFDQSPNAQRYLGRLAAREHSTLQFG